MAQSPLDYESKSAPAPRPASVAVYAAVVNVISALIAVAFVPDWYWRPYVQRMPYASVFLCGPVLAFCGILMSAKHFRTSNERLRAWLLITLLLSLGSWLYIAKLILSD
jgi:hypothetical protein